MIYKDKESGYNRERVKVFYEDGKTIYKLYRNGELVYIGVHDGPRDGKRLDDNDRQLDDERLGVPSGNGHVRSGV